MKKILSYICVFTLIMGVLAACQNKDTGGSAVPDANVPADGSQVSPPPAEPENADGENNDNAAEQPELASADEPPTQKTVDDSFWPVGFETDTATFTGRGDELVKQSDEYAYEGEHSLYVYDRTQAWNGARIDVTRFIRPGVDYEFSLWVFVPEDEYDTFFVLSAQTNFGDSESYANLKGSEASKTAKAGTWTYLSGTTSFLGYDTAYFYIETNNTGKEISFYIDEASLVAVGGEIDMTAEVLPSLAEIYKDYFMIGCAGEFNLFMADSLPYQVMSNTFNAITPENSMKPQSVQGAKGVFTFSSSDSLVSAAKENGMTVIGHTLAWHQQSPAWLNSKDLSRDEAIENLKTHIKEVMSHYGGDVYSWDVVNEAFDDNITNPGNWRTALRECAWKTAIGDDYIEIAFRAAREANPDVLLYYNDYNLDYPDKREAVYSMAKEFIEKGVPIDGIGMQGHYNMSTSAASVERSIARFAELGLKVSITELDITVNDAKDDGLTEAQELAQAIKYAELFQVFRAYKDTVERVTLWGISDGTSWRGDRYPLLFDKAYKAKKAFWAVADPDSFLYENAVTVELPPCKAAKAVYGTPVIGGDPSAWDKAEEIQVNNFIMAWEGATGTARVLWDENNLYILFRVNDSLLNAAANDSYRQDSVEIFIDENNAKTDTYQMGDSQTRISFNNLVTFNPNEAPSKGEVKSAASIVDGGYIIQVAIPLQTITGAEGMTIGFDLQINDADDKGQRTSVAKWNDLTDNSYRTTEGFGVLELIK